MPMSGAIETLKGDINKAHNIAIPIKFIDECKSAKDNYKLPAWWSQSCGQCGQFERPLLHMKLNNKEPISILYTEDLFTILGALVEAEDKLRNMSDDMQSEITENNNYDKNKHLRDLKFLKDKLSITIREYEKKILKEE